jgi:hypothetical protein
LCSYSFFKINSYSSYMMLSVFSHTHTFLSYSVIFMCIRDVFRWWAIGQLPNCPPLKNSWICHWCACLW